MNGGGSCSSRIVPRIQLPRLHVLPAPQILNLSSLAPLLLLKGRALALVTCGRKELLLSCAVVLPEPRHCLVID